MKTSKNILTALVAAAIVVSVFIGLSVCPLSNVNAQGVGINPSGNNPDPSAILDASSTTKGTLITRMTTTERNAISNPAQSLLIFNTTTKCFEFYESGVWQIIACSCTSVPSAPATTAGSGASTTTITANWSASSGATGYYLDVSTDIALGGFVIGYNNLNVGNALTLSVTGLTCNTTYYYRVRAYNTCGTSSNSGIITYATFACPLNACSNLSTVTDSRDNKVYNIVAIGNQCWMAQNLNYGTYVAVVNLGQAGAGTQKYCQNLSAANDASCPLGGLYEWAEMMNGSSSCNGTGASQIRCSTPVQGICPTGWHIPSHYEWTRLERVVGGSDSTAFPYDITTTGWLGTAGEGSNLKEAGTSHWTSPNICTPPGACNSSGFTAFPGGYSYSGSFYGVGSFGNWWSATASDGLNAWNRYLGSTESEVLRSSNYAATDKTAGISVRCLKD